MKLMLNKGFIYIIYNVINNNFYLGSTRFLNKRKSKHFNELRSGNHHSVILQNAYNKYGENNFEFKVVNECELNDILILEQLYLDICEPIYNIAKNALAPMTGRNHNKKTKRQMSKAHKGNKYNLGKKASEETKRKQSLKRLGTKRSKKTKNKMRKTALKNKQHKFLLPSIMKRRRSIKDSLNNKFESMVECSKFWNISVQTVCDILKGRHKQTRKGISFRYV